MTLFATLAILAGMGTPPPKPRPVGLVENILRSEAIVEGTVVVAPGKPDGSVYPLVVEKVYRGTLKPARKIQVAAVKDWTCCKRFRPYRRNERLLLFLVSGPGKDHYKPYGDHFSEVAFLEGGKARGCDEYYGTPVRAADPFRELVSELIRYCFLKDKEAAVETWLLWFTMENPQLRRYAADRARWDMTIPREYWTPKPGERWTPGTSHLSKLVDGRSAARFFSAILKLLSGGDPELKLTAGRTIGPLARFMVEIGVPEGFDLKALKKEAADLVEPLARPEKREWVRIELEHSVKLLRR